MVAVEAGRRTNRLLVWFSVWMAALTGSFFVWDSTEFVPGRTVTAGLVGVSAAAAILYGVRVYSPARRMPWFLLAGAVFVHSMARVVYGLLGLVNPLDRNGARAVPEYALHLVSTVLLVAAFLVFVRPRGRSRESLAVIDASIVVLGIGLLVWVYATQPLLTATQVAGATVAVRGAYLLRDLAILGAVARFAAGVRWNTSVALLTSGTVSLLVYGAVIRLQGFAQGLLLWGGLFEVFWYFSYAALGAAALVPSMAKVGTQEERSETSATSLVLIALTALIPFAVVLAHPGLRGVGATTAVDVVAAVMLALVLLRLTVGALRLRRSLAQSQAVSQASAQLVSAADVPSIASAVSRAAKPLFGAKADPTLRLDLGDGGRGTDGGRGDAYRGEPSHPELRVPLRVPAGPAGSEGPASSGPALVARAPAAALAGARAALDSVAAQASLALARVQLTDEVNNTRRDEYFRALVQNSTDVILIIEPDLTIRYATPSAEKMFETATVDGRWLPGLLDPSDQGHAETLLIDIYGGRIDAASTVRTDWRLGGDSDRRVAVSCVDLRTEAAIRGVVITLRDVTDQRRLEERLTMQAFHDPLTGVGNRSLFTTAVESALQTTRDGTCAGAIFIDLDDFKAINDGFGHAVGDALLRDVAQRIEATAEPYGLAARIGGDEFAVLMSSAADPAEIDNLADLLVRTLSEPTTIMGELVRCGASVGVATTLDAETAEDLLRHADLALYEAKGSGKRQWRRYDPTMRLAVTERLELRAMLVDALSSDTLRVEFQPIVSLHRGEAVGFEALLRWDHPTRGLLPAAEFIEYAEDSGLIDEIGEWVLGSSAREAVRWSQATRGSAPFVSVNVSPRQFENPAGFVEMVRHHLAETGLRADQLVLEITERILIADSSDVADALAMLRRQGVRIAIDDFGTGYSGLGYLQRVPLDIIKLDRMFTRGMAFSGQQRDLVASIVHMAKTLHLDVVAEGVETVRESTMVRESGCAYGQGYLFSRPLTADVALRWATGQRRADPATIVTHEESSPA